MLLCMQERDRKLIVECFPSDVHTILNDVECPSALTQPQRILLTRAQTVEGPPYYVNGKESEYLVRVFAELQHTMKDLKRNIELQVRTCVTHTKLYNTKLQNHMHIYILIDA